jgi:RNA polymerase sigma-70 factor (ECF subfamily)
MPKTKQPPKEFIERAYSHARRLYRLAYARLGNAEDAEDVLQDSYIKAFRAYESFRGGSNLEAWLATILMNTLRDHLRKTNRNQKPLSIDAAEDSEQMLQIADPHQGPEDEAIDNEFSADLREALDSTPDWMLSPFLLREIEELSYKEIAQTLQIPMGTVMSRLSRARQFLVKRLSLTNPSSARTSSAQSLGGPLEGGAQ